MWCRLAWLVVLAALLVAGRVASAQTIEQQLGLWEQTHAGVSYQGSFVYERKGVFSTHQVWHRGGQDGSYQERFLRLNGTPFEVLREDGRLRCMTRLHDAGPVVSNQSALPLRQFDVERIRKGYRIELLGESRVADRVAAAVLFAPRDVHRYPLEVHFDMDTGVVLKSLLLNEQGELLERFQFVHFEPGEVERIHLEPQHCQNMEPAAESAAEPAVGWQEGWLPEGYDPVGNGQLYGPDGLSSHLYSDGLSYFSIFIEPVDGVGPEIEHRQMGPTAVISRPLNGDDGLRMVTVLGEIPAATAQRIALSVSLAQGESPHD